MQYSRWGAWALTRAGHHQIWLGLDVNGCKYAALRKWRCSQIDPFVPPQVYRDICLIQDEEKNGTQEKWLWTHFKDSSFSHKPSDHLLQGWSELDVSTRAKEGMVSIHCLLVTGGFTSCRYFIRQNGGKTNTLIKFNTNPLPLLMRTFFPPTSEDSSCQQSITMRTGELHFPDQGFAYQSGGRGRYLHRLGTLSSRMGLLYKLHAGHELHLSPSLETH